MNAHNARRGALVIGFGNSFRGDDAVGFDVARRLSAQAHAGAVRVHACTQLTPELAESVADAGLVIFVDASVCDAAGTVTCYRLEPASPWRSTPVHLLDPLGLLDCTFQCFGKAPSAYVFSIGGGFFGYRQGLSDAVAAGEKELIDRVNALIAWWQGRVAQCKDAECEVVTHA